MPYYLNTKSGTTNYKCLVLWNNNVHWKFCGVAHTVMKCLDKPTFTKSEELVCDDVYLHCRTTGARSLDPDKYYKDALILKDQFFNSLYNDPDGLYSRSVFYTAQSYLDAKEYKLALKWDSLYIKLKSPIKHTQVLGYSYGLRCYLPREKDFPINGWDYDSKYAVPDLVFQFSQLPAAFHPESEKVVINKTLEMIKQINV